MNEKDCEKLTEQLFKTVNVLNREMKTAWDYGVGFSLYHSEIHLIDMIRNHEGSNAKELSEFLGVTNGAVWQTARKLTRKGLIESYREPHNKKEVYFRLTDLGRKASDGHKQHHETINAEFADYAENHIGDNDLSAIMGFLKMVVKSTPGK